MKFIDLFAGIGGFRMGMELAGHECVGYVEIDKFARKSYEIIYDTEGEWTAHDITSVTEEELRFLATRGIDVICGGFPCQAFSVAGKRLGFEDTRGTLFFEIARFTKEIKPRYLFLENVKGLLSHDQGRTFETILLTLDELGYDAEWQVLNSKDFGVPQNRERVFIIGHLRGQRTRKVFPITGENEKTINVVGLLDIKGQEHTKRVYHPSGLSPCLTTSQGGMKKPKIVQVRHNVTDGCKIRELTPREYWRLQGFPDWAFEKAAKVNSDTQLYKQAGNAVTVNVIYEIAKRLKEGEMSC